MQPLFFLTLVVVGFAGYKLGQFITFRDLAKFTAENIQRAIDDNASGTPIARQVSRETGIEL